MNGLRETCGVSTVAYRSRFRFPTQKVRFRNDKRSADNPLRRRGTTQRGGGVMITFLLGLFGIVFVFSGMDRAAAERR